MLWSLEQAHLCSQTEVSTLGKNMICPTVCYATL